MTPPGNEAPKNPAAHLHILNLIVALCAGLISVVGGIYSLKANFFSPKTGTLQGIVRDGSIAKPLWLTPVEVSEANGSVIATLNTDQTGRYALTSLREGDYVVKVSAPLHKIQSKDVKIYSNNASTVNFDLAPEEQKSFSRRDRVRAARAAPNSYDSGPEETGYETPQRTSPYGTGSSYPRRSYRRQSSTGWNSPQDNPINDPSNQGFNGPSDSNTASTANPLRDTLTRTVGQFIQDWASKKTENKTSS